MRGMIGKSNAHGPQPDKSSATGVEKFRQELMSITLPGMQAFWQSLLNHIKSEIEVVTLDVSFNDPLYAETVLRLFDQMMSDHSKLRIEHP
jgi:hypothetical protein